MITNIIDTFSEVNPEIIQTLVISLIGIVGILHLLIKSTQEKRVNEAKAIAELTKVSATLRKELTEANVKIGELECQLQTKQQEIALLQEIAKEVPIIKAQFEVLRKEYLSILEGNEGNTNVRQSIFRNIPE